MRIDEAGRILKSVWSDRTIEEIIGSGANGDVYRISRVGYDTCSALKIIEVSGEGGSEKLESLKNEIEMLEELSGAPHIVRIEDYAFPTDENGTVVAALIRMELLTPLSRLYPMSEDDVVRLGIDICSALEICSEKGICHRDIKPSNILATEWGEYKLADFGISKIMDGGDYDMTMDIGTPNYMAPEVVTSTDYDCSADLYSLGIVMYTLLNGQRIPFLPLDKQICSGTDLREAYVKRMRGDKMPPPVSASAPLAKIILKACEYSPEKRYASAHDMKKELEVLKVSSYVPVKAGAKGIAAKRETRLTKGRTYGEKIRSINFGKRTFVYALMCVMMFFAVYGMYSMLRSVFAPRDEVAAENTVNESEESYFGLASVSVGTYPEKLVYSVGESLDTTGMTLNAVYSNGDELHISDGFTFSPELFENVGGETVTIEYMGICTELYVTVDSPYIFALSEDRKSVSVLGLSKPVTDLYLPNYYNGLPVTEIGEKAFYLNQAIKSIHLPAMLTTIRYKGLYEVSNVSSLYIPATLVNIDDSEGSFALGGIELDEIIVDPDNPRYYVDGDCMIDRETKTVVLGTKKSVIPDDGSVEHIGSSAFVRTLHKVSEFVLPEGIRSIGRYGIFDPGIVNLRLPSTLEDIQSASSFVWMNKLESIEVAEGNPRYYSSGSCLLERDGTTLLLGCVNSVIPDGVTAIGKNAFQNSMLTELYIPESVTVIGDYAFAQSFELLGIRLPSGVVLIGERAFSDCEALEEIYLPAALEAVEKGAFYGCSSLKTVYYGGGEEDWRKISIDGENNEYLLAAQIIFDADGSDLDKNGN